MTLTPEGAIALVLQQDSETVAAVMSRLAARARLAGLAWAGPSLDAWSGSGPEADRLRYSVMVALSLLAEKAGRSRLGSLEEFARDADGMTVTASLSARPVLPHALPEAERVLLAAGAARAMPALSQGLGGAAVICRGFGRRVMAALPRGLSASVLPGGTSRERLALEALRRAAIAAGKGGSVPLGTVLLAGAQNAQILSLAIFRGAPLPAGDADA